MSIREKAMAALRNHKSGWVKLGESLIEIDSKELWKEWGHEDFKEYCKNELGITEDSLRHDGSLQVHEEE